MNEAGFDSALMYTCSLIERIGRDMKLRRGEVVEGLGREAIERIYRHADVLHCEPIERVADEYARLSSLEQGDFDNVAACRYDPPDYWAIGKVFERLIEDVATADTISTLMEVYGSWICDAVSNYNSDLFYQPRDYLRECYLAGEVIAA